MTDSRAASGGLRAASVAEQLDAAVSQLLAGGRISGPLEPELRPLVRAARLLARALAPVPVAPRFEARVGARLADTAERPLARRVRGLGELTREIRHPGRLIAAGAVSSAAVGVGVTALAVWRGGRRGARRRR
ncbi:MAG TPA: hypothetical protein VHK06_00580 [Candidatus Limnocylindria bacterium]|nr:hypothetical protein [Candidatus Limnocylindria bacterium]